jgi:protein O-GlcNAc transferase
MQQLTASDLQEIQLRTARAHAASGRFAAAREAANGLLSVYPRCVPGWVLLAQLEMQLRNMDGAHAAAARARQLEPRNVDALYVLGRVHKSRGELPAARQCYERAVAARPDDPDLLTSLGIVLRSLGELDAAIAMYRRALERRPDHPEAQHNLGNALKERGEHEAARAASDRGRALLGEQLQALEAAALAALRGNANTDALASLEQVMSISPLAAVNMLSGGEFAVEMSKRHLNSMRLRLAEQVVERDPKFYPAIELARGLSVAGGLYERAARYGEMSLALDPSDAVLLQSELALPAVHASLDALRAARLRLENAVGRLEARQLRLAEPYNVIAPGFYLPYHGENDRELQIRIARTVLRASPELAEVAPHLAAARRPGKTRVGFISRFFADHSIGKTSVGLIEQLSRARFEVHALHITPHAYDSMSERIDAGADHTHKLSPSVTIARGQLSALELDVLFYQDIGMEPTSYLLAFGRVARVQCLSFGHPNTTGIPNLDYFVSNDLFEPAGADAHYSERLFLLRDLPTLAYYYRPKPPARRFDRDAFGLPREAHLYLCPQVLFKIHPEFDALLGGILGRDPAARVVLIEGDYEEWTETLRQRFAHTIPDVAHRISFLARQSTERYLSLLAAADVVLDTLHFNGMNTSLEAFAVGTPVVTLPGALQRGRHTQGMYRKMGISECVARDAEDYVNIALRLGTDRGFAEAMRAKLLSQHHLLYEDRRVVEEFERFFLESLGENV